MTECSEQTERRIWWTVLASSDHFRQSRTEASYQWRGEQHLSAPLAGLVGERVLLTTRVGEVGVNLAELRIVTSGLGTPTAVAHGTAAVDNLLTVKHLTHQHSTAQHSAAQQQSNTTKANREEEEKGDDRTADLVSYGDRLQRVNACMVGGRARLGM